jgi:hypothetical protein
MMSYDANDANADSVRGLMMLAADPDRAARVRARCRTARAAAGARYALRYRIRVTFLRRSSSAACAFYVAMLVPPLFDSETMFD